MQWKLSNMGIFGTKIIVLIMRCPYFRGRIIMYLLKLGLSQVSWLTNVSLFQRCPLREVPLYKFCRGLQGPFLVLEVFAKEGIVNRIRYLRHFW